MAEQSIIIQYEREAPAPSRPPHRRGLIAWLTHANVRAQAQYARDRRLWAASGGKVTHTMHIPRALVTHEGGEEVTIEALPQGASFYK